MTTLDDLLRRDKQREKDGWPRKVKIGKIVRPGKHGGVVIVPGVTEEKFYHGTPQNQQGAGGTGEGEEGDVVGEIPIEEHGEQGEGGEGDGGDHEIETQAYELGRTLTDEFNLPNLQDKGRKPSLTKKIYELAGIRKGTGNVLDRKKTLKNIFKTNLVLGNISENDIDPTKMIIDPKDRVYRVFTEEQDFENQAMVFFLRDYSGSMQGDPTKVVVQTHLMFYSWLMYQYKKNVESRFIVHDTSAKEVPNFHQYYNSTVAGGTDIATAFDLVNKIVSEERVAKDYNIYVFYGGDGGDWKDGEETIKGLKEMMGYSNRIGITVAQNDWGNESLGGTKFNEYMNKSGLLKDKSDLLKLYSMMAAEASDDEIIKGIKYLLS